MISVIYRDDMLASLEAARPKSVLVVGPDGDELFGEYLRAHPGVRCQHLDAGDIDKIDTRSDLAFVSNTLEHLGKDDGNVLISRLRDVHCRRLYAVVCLSDEYWSGIELIALGLRPVKRYVQDGAELWLFRYDLHDYKQTPEWLSNKNWANPELWNKFRW